MNRRLDRMQKQVRASYSPNDGQDELLWREVMTQLTDDELRSLRAALQRCVGEYGYLPEDAPILERCRELYAELDEDARTPHFLRYD